MKDKSMCNKLLDANVEAINRLHNLTEKLKQTQQDAEEAVIEGAESKKKVIQGPWKQTPDD